MKLGLRTYVRVLGYKIFLGYKCLIINNSGVNGRIKTF